MNSVCIAGAIADVPLQVVSSMLCFCIYVFGVMMGKFFDFLMRNVLKYFDLR